MTPDELRILERELWKDVEDPRFVDKDKVTPLTSEQLSAVLACVKEHNLMCTISGVGFFGSIGLMIFDGPTYPGLGSNLLLFISQYHLPAEDYPKSHTPTGGNPPDDAWELFSSLVFDEKNLSRLKWSGIEEPRRHQSDYAY